MIKEKTPLITHKENKNSKTSFKNNNLSKITLELENIRLRGELKTIKEINLDLQRQISSKEKTFQIIINYLTFLNRNSIQIFIDNFERFLILLKTENNEGIIFNYLVNNLENFLKNFKKVSREKQKITENYEMNPEENILAQKIIYQAPESKISLESSGLNLNMQTNLNSNTLLSLNSEKNFSNTPDLEFTKNEEFDESEIIKIKINNGLNEIKLTSSLLSSELQNMNNDSSKKLKEFDFYDNLEFVKKSKIKFKESVLDENKFLTLQNQSFLNNEISSMTSYLNNSIDNTLIDMRKNLEKLNNERNEKSGGKKQFLKYHNNNLGVENNFNFKNINFLKKNQIGSKLDNKSNSKTISKKTQNLKKKIKLKIKIDNPNKKENSSKLARLRQLRNLDKSIKNECQNKQIFITNLDKKLDIFFKTQDHDKKKGLTKRLKFTKREGSKKIKKQILRKIKSQDLFNQKSPLNKDKKQLKNK